MPTFPTFKKLELDDKTLITDFVNQYPPYSEFNFVNLWNWNIREDREFSFLNSSLVLKFTDGISNEPYMTFLGSTSPTETIRVLLEYASLWRCAVPLRKVPEICLPPQSEETIIIDPDRDNHDYVYCLSNTIRLKGHSFRAHRNCINRFKKLYPKCEITVLQLTSPSTRKQIVQLWNVWSNNSTQNREHFKNELIALERLMNASHLLETVTFGFYVENKLVGFTVNEVIQSDFAMGHFGKADPTFVGIYKYMEQETAKRLSALGCKFINNQQTLGISGLEFAKENWQPVSFLRKYRITSCTEGYTSPRSQLVAVASSSGN